MLSAPVEAAVLATLNPNETLARSNFYAYAKLHDVGADHARIRRLYDTQGPERRSIRIFLDGSPDCSDEIEPLFGMEIDQELV
jgi:hypothetical protein